MKKEKFHWPAIATRAFSNIKFKIPKALVLIHLDFYKAFKVAYDAFDIEIRGVLSQEGHLVAYFSKNSMILSKDIPHMIKSFILLFRHLHFDDIIYYP